ncbi:MAG: hypothetical protein ACRC92_26385 [Peptostreptococcaceae bacterium]
MVEHIIRFLYEDGVTVDLCRGKTVPGIRLMKNRQDLSDKIKFMSLPHTVDESVLRLNIPFIVDIDGIQFMSVGGIIGYDVVDEKSDGNIHITLDLPDNNSVMVNNMKYIVTFDNNDKLDDVCIIKDKHTYYMDRKMYPLYTMDLNKRLVKMTYHVEPNENVENAVSNILSLVDSVDILTICKRNMNDSDDSVMLKNMLIDSKQQVVVEERFKVQIDDGVHRIIYGMDDKFVIQGVDLICTVLSKIIKPERFQKEC